MIAYKGVGLDGANRLGKGKIVYEVGKTYTEEKSKTVASGFHCCENPFECLSYYNLGDDRFFEVEAGGSIDEDGDERIACTEMTVLRELSIPDFMFAGITYMVTHPKRDKWEQNKKNLVVGKDTAEGELVTIARGRSPKAAGIEGGYIGLIQESSKGEIINVRLKKVDGREIKPGTYYTLKFGKVVPA
jgi:hypothetical protein